MTEASDSRVPTKRCLACSYDLRGLPENRCPECGRPFDPGDAKTFVSRLRPGRRYLAASVGGAAAIAIPLMVGYLNDMRAFVSRLPKPVEVGLTLLLLLCLLGGVATEVHVLRFSSSTLFREPGTAQHRRAFGAAFAVSWLIVFGAIVYVIALLVAVYRGPRIGF